MSIFIGQPIYSLKNIRLGGDTVEKPVIFEGQEDVLLKRGAWKAKSESSTASIQRLSPLGMPFLTFIGQQCYYVSVKPSCRAYLSNIASLSRAEEGENCAGVADS